MKKIIDLAEIKEHLRYLTIVIPMFLWAYFNYKLFKGELEEPFDIALVFLNTTICVFLLVTIILWAWL